MPKSNSPSKAPEILWLAVAFMTVVTGVHKSFNHGITESWYFFGFTFLALAVFLLRRNLRRKSDKED